MQRDAAGWAAGRCVGAWVQQQLSCLQDAKGLQQAVECVDAVLQQLIRSSQDDGATQLEQGAGACTGSSQVQRALLQHAQAVGWPALQRSFFEEYYKSWTTAVLTGERRPPHACSPWFCLVLSCQRGAAAQAHVYVPPATSQ
eukprot:GHRQ01007685.1.p2 GENE.GHRQ01007685.1~~GHRQ01007685.1.p2  ORF type:complete len:142 (-),score=28.57 GHRQ01007685.1:30-455(-)